MSVERTLTVSAPYYGTANVLVVGGEGPKASRYTVVLWPGGGNAPLLQNNGMEPTATGVVTSDSADTYVPEPSGGGGGTPPTCPAGQHYDTATSACVVDAASGGSGGPPGGSSDPFWTAAFWKNLFVSLFTPTNGTLSRFSTVWGRLASWGPFGLSTALSADMATLDGLGFDDTAPVFTFENVWATFGPPSPDGAAAPPLILDLRPALGPLESSYANPSGQGSMWGSVIHQLRVWMGYLTYVGAGVMLFHWVRPRVSM